MADYLVSFPGLGIIDLPLRRIAFSFSLFGREIAIYWYGVLIAGAFLLGMLLSLRQAAKYDLDPDHISEMYLALIPLALIGARLYYVLFAWQEFSDDWVRVFDTRTGGLAFYGGVIGGVLGVILVSLLRHLPITRVMDFLIVYVPLGQAIGRWGNFFNQEAFGTNTNLPWGMISNGTTAYLQRYGDPTVNPLLPVHPTFFYEFVANLLIFALLLLVRRRRRWPLETVASYLILYGLVRFFVEGIRTDALYIGASTVRVSQWLSAGMVVAGLLLQVILGLRYRRQLQEEVTVDETLDILD